jgi:prepilin-type N-terminal cleavage/methylation domain-containing protein
MRQSAQGAQGFTLVELMVVIAILGIVAAMTAVRLDRARSAGNEASAIGSLRAINSAESAYASSCGAAGYAQSLEDLAKAPPGSPQAFISVDLMRNGVVKSGYVVGVQADSGATIVTPSSRACNAPSAHAMSSYFASAVPASQGSSGRRTFATDKRATIYFREDGVPIASGMYGAVPLQ